jgi:hypothetical protein
MNSPVSQKDTVGAIVTKYITKEMTKRIDAKTISGLFFS